jgi:hypothetical protein
MSHNVQVDDLQSYIAAVEQQWVAWTDQHNKIPPRGSADMATPSGDSSRDITALVDALMKTGIVTNSFSEPFPF